MQKKWIVGIILAVVLAFLALAGMYFMMITVTTVKYGTPHYRPKIL